MNANQDNNEEYKSENINPKEVGFTPAAKEIKAQEKIDIKESDLGREQGQVPAEEEQQIGQIDEGTKEIQSEQEIRKEELVDGEIEDALDLDDKTSGYMNDNNVSADRDTGNKDHSENWENQDSRTARHK